MEGREWHPPIFLFIIIIIFFLNNNYYFVVVVVVGGSGRWKVEGGRKGRGCISSVGEYI
jgi:hypothetical protein